MATKHSTPESLWQCLNRCVKVVASEDLASEALVKVDPGGADLKKVGLAKEKERDKADRAKVLGLVEKARAALILTDWI